MPNQLKISTKTLAGQILICVALAVASVAFVIGMFAYDRICKRSLQTECNDNAQHQFNLLVVDIENWLNSAKAPAVDVIPNLQAKGIFDFRNEEQVYSLLENIVRENETISGAIILFEDWVYPQYSNKNGFGPLVRKKGNNIARFQLGETRDFRKESECYQRLLNTPQADWSQPFLSDDSVLIATYIVPLFENGSFVGGLGIDIDLSQLNIEVYEKRPFQSSYVIVVDESLNILTHPNSDYIGRTKLTDSMQKAGIELNTHHLQRSKNHIGGVGYNYLNTRSMAFYYAPIPNTNWFVILYCPTDEIYAPIMTQHPMFIATTIGGFLLLFILFALSFFKLFKVYRRWRNINASF